MTPSEFAGFLLWSNAERFVSSVLIDMMKKREGDPTKRVDAANLSEAHRIEIASEHSMRRQCFSLLCNKRDL